MSSEDVIELGSSDEESEPAPKRSKPNTKVVCVPRNLHEITIKPSRPNAAAIAKGLGKGITVTKIVGPKQPSAPKNRFNGRPSGQALKPKVCINPFSEAQRQVERKSIFIPTYSKVSLTKPAVQLKPAPLLKNPIKIKNSGTLNLPPSITIKKTVAYNRPLVMLNVKSKEELNQRNCGIGEILTVELDDDEAVTHNSSPQWYVRPEDQIENTLIEEENNKEPDSSKLIEITIDDSPIKPVLNKRTHEVGAELAITIDDSPVKVSADKNKSASGSENESDSAVVPHSKKKLEYPKESDSRKTVEIEIDPHEISLSTYSVEVDDKLKANNGLKIESSEKSECASSKENKIEVQNNSSSEFHPVYQSFIDVCFQLENSDDMKKIVEKKIKGYYKQVPKVYTECEEFIDMVSSKILSMKACPEKMYLYIKDIVDELNLQRKLAKTEPVIKETKAEEPVQQFGEESEYDSKRQRQIRKLEKTIKKLHRAIQKLEEQEVDFDDEDDSVYLLTERYKERMVRVYTKFCQLSNTKMPSEPRIHIDARPGQPLGPAKRLEKWINKKVPIGTPLPFPDFHDVLRCVRESNIEDKLNLNEADIMEEARDLFTRCGRKLQRRRQENEWRLAASRIALDIDPAEASDELKKQLNENKKIAAHKETEIFNKYADRQNQLKLEAEEIGDKEAEESPVESEEDEANDGESVFLENTEKRKERLKRLLQEKSRKSCEEKENQPSNEDQVNENDTTPEEKILEEEATSKVESDKKESEIKDKEVTDDNMEEKCDEKPTTPNATETLILSDDSHGLESDIDELHLLQKLHSGNEDHSSTVDTSDSESPIAISDSLDSSDDNKMDLADDVISIENSSYSENDDDKIDNTQESNADSVQFINEDSMPSQDSERLSPINESETESPGAEAVPAPAQTNNDEYLESVENILLASSEEDNGDSQEAITEEACINLRDDLISIDETFIGSITGETDIQEEQEPNNKSLKKISEDNLVEKNIDLNDTSIKQDAENEKSNEVKSDESHVKTTINIVSDAMSIEPVEVMDIDQNDCTINESEILAMPEDSISTISPPKKS